MSGTEEESVRTFGDAGCVCQVDVFEILLDIFLQFGECVVEIWQAKRWKATEHRDVLCQCSHQQQVVRCLYDDALCSMFDC